MEKLTDEQKELLKRCRYYKGEKEWPEGVDFFFWETEQLYVLKEGSWPEAEKVFRDDFGWLDIEGIDKAFIPFLYAVYVHVQHHGDIEADGGGFADFVNGYITGSTSI
jgi:hypothetical protein